MRKSLAVVAALWAALGAAPAHAVSDAGGLCGPVDDPCVVSTTIAVDDGAVLDLGSRTLQVATGARLDGGAGTMTINAGAVVLKADGRLVAEGRIYVNTTGGIQTEESSRIDASGPLGGLVSLSAKGDVSLAGILDAHSTGPADGGLVAVSGNNVTLTEAARIQVRGDVGAGGSVAFIAVGALVVDAPIDATGDESGGAVEADAVSMRLNGRIDVSGGPGGAGAIVDLRARGPLVVNGTIDGDARGGVEAGGGIGAEVSMQGTDAIELNGPISLNGGAPGGEGGLVDIQTAGDVTQRGAITARGNGPDGVGGEIRISTDAGVTLGDVDIGGGYAANRITVGSKGVVRLTGTISGEPTSGFGFGGVVELSACALDMDSTALVSTLGKEGRNSLTASGQMLLRGKVESGGENDFTIRDAAVPPVILGTVSPAPTTTVDPTLAPCDAGPPPGETTTTTIAFGECGDPSLAPYDTLLCRLSAIKLTLANASPASLGGRRPARGFRHRIARALRAVEQARAGKRVATKLASASVQLSRLLASAQRGLDKGRLDAAIGARLQDLGSRAAAEIATLRV